MHGGEGFLWVALIGLMYFLPTLTAWQRHSTLSGTVFVLNFFLGWTFIGWVVALAIAVAGKRPAGPPRLRRTR